MRTDFWNYLEHKLSAAQWSGLQQSLNCSAHRLTKLRNGKQDFSVHEIETIAGLTGDNPVELTHKYQLGYTTNTIEDMRVFFAKHGHKLLHQVNAA